MADYVLVEKSQGVAILTMNRPEQLNAMNYALSIELHDAVVSMNADDEVGCIVITGAGKRAFSAGGDIHEQREDDRQRSQAELDARGAERGRGSYEISASPKPTIGMINGLAFGGAGVLASSLDMRVGCEHASFRFLAAAYGRINSTWTLPNQVGWPIAKELLFSARIVEAEEAYRIGLLNHLVPCAELRDKKMPRRRFRNSSRDAGGRRRRNAWRARRGRAGGDRGRSTIQLTVTSRRGRACFFSVGRVDIAYTTDR